MNTSTFVNHSSPVKPPPKPWRWTGPERSDGRDWITIRDATDAEVCRVPLSLADLLYMGENEALSPRVRAIVAALTGEEMEAGYGWFS